MKDYYFILGVSPNTSPDEIKEAFRKLCLRYHPDRAVSNSYAAERYMEICEAYKVLSNSNKKIIYDKRLARHRARVSNNSNVQTSVKDAIIPELKSSYKGHYPWFAIFSILIVCGIILIFVSTLNPNPKPDIVSGSSFTPINHIPAAPDTTKTPPISAASVKAFIISTLKANTPDKIFESLDSDTSRKSQFSYSEQYYNYSFIERKLVVTYVIGYKGLSIRKKVTIPCRDVNNIYLYKQHLWICNNKKSIRDANLSTGYIHNTDFFSVKFADNAEAERELLQAFAQLNAI